MESAKSRLRQISIAVGGLALLAFSARRVMTVFDFGFTYVLAPLVALGGLYMFLEACFDEDDEPPRTAPNRSETEYEQALLRAAVGRTNLSAESAALATGLSLAQAQALLRRLEVEGYTVSVIDDFGGRWYSFPGLRLNRAVDAVVLAPACVTPAGESPAPTMAPVFQENGATTSGNCDANQLAQR